MLFCGKMWPKWWEKISGNSWKIHHRYYKYLGSRRVPKAWWKKLSITWGVGWLVVSLWVFWHMSFQAIEKRNEILASMCDESARLLEDQFNVSMNHLQAMSILISTFHHGNNPSAIDQSTFLRYTKMTGFDGPLKSVAYAVRVLHSERAQFEGQQGWTIKRMDNFLSKKIIKKRVDNFEHNPVQEEYAPIIFAQETISSVVSLNLLSEKQDREQVMLARESGKGVLTAPFRLLKSNRLGVVLTFAICKMDLPSNATPNERIQATVGYLGGVLDVESLVENLLQQLASKQTILVNVYDTTNCSHPISMYGSNVSDDGSKGVSTLNLGDPFRKHEMHCRFKQKTPWPWLAIETSIDMLVIAYLVGYIFHATVNRIAKVEDDYNDLEELERKAEAAYVATSQFLATVSYELRTPMNYALRMLHMLMGTDLDVTQQDYVRTAQAIGKAVVSLINQVLLFRPGKDTLELDAVQFNLREILDDVLSLFSGESQEKGVELAVYISDRVPEVLIGDPGRFRQIITNLMGNSIKFTEKGHIFVTVHLVEEVIGSTEVETSSKNTLNGFSIAVRQCSFEGFKTFSQEGPNCLLSSSSSDLINLIVSVEDTGVGIPLEACEGIFFTMPRVAPRLVRTLAEL